MVSRLAVIAMLAMLAPAAAAHAQDPLSLQQAIAATLANNPDLRAAEAGQRESAERANEARASYLPRVDLVEAWQRGNNPVFVFGSLLSQQRFTMANFALDALNHPDPLTNYHAALTVDQPIYDSSRISGIKSAGLGKEVAAASLAEARADLALATTRAYGDLLQATANRAAAEAAVAAAREDLARAEHGRDVGMVTEADVLSLRVHLAQMQERQIRATSGVSMASAQLNRLMGAPLDRPLLLADPALAPVTVPAAADAEKEAVSNRAAFKRAALQVSLAETARSAAKQAFLPQAYFQGLYEWNGHSFGDRASSWLIAGQIRINLFAGLGDMARLHAAADAEQRARAERESAESGLKLEVQNARAQLEAAVAREAVGRTAVLQARESQRIIRDRFEAGLAGVSDVLRAANALLDAELLRTSSNVDVIVVRATLDRAMGRVPSGN
jgi:outer membrane protein TolC